MTYQDVIKYLENLGKFGDKPGLHRMASMLEALDNPHRSLKCVHITGTDGKGSTSAMVNSILQSAGYKVGLFTSPHLQKYTERIKVGGIDISDEDFVQVFRQVKGVLDNDASIKPALFEVITVMAFLYFSQQKVDIAVVEVGLGGRVDSTNVIDGLVCAITNINLEHTEVFGDTREAIALEKAGIIKPNSTVVTSEQDDSIRNIIKNEADKKGASFEFISHEDIQLNVQTLEGQVFSVGGFKNLELSLLGAHQLLNASLAISCVQALSKHGFDIVDGHIRDGLRQVRWPLRLEIVHQNPTILIDVAHNPYGVGVVKRTIDELFPREGRVLVMGCSFDKPYEEMARDLSDLASVIIVTKAKYHAVDPKKLVESIEAGGKRIYETASVKEAMALAKKFAVKESLIMVLGGLYLGAEAKKFADVVF